MIRRWEMNRVYLMPEDVVVHGVTYGNSCQELDGLEEKEDMCPPFLFMCVLFLDLLSCPYLLGAQAVLVVVVCGYAVGTEGGIAIALPSAAQVYRVVYASQSVATADGNAHGIVFAIAHVGESYLAHYRSVEGTWSAQSVDAQCVVHAILGRPLAVIYDAWGQCLQVKVA